MRIFSMKTNIQFMQHTANSTFEMAFNEFQEQDKGKVNSQTKLLTDIGANLVTIKLLCDKIESNISILEDLTDGITDQTAETGITQ